MATFEEIKRYLSYDPEKGMFKSVLNPDKTVGFLNKDGYVILRLGATKQISAGKAAFLLMTGEYPSGDIDHINRVRTDNRWCNLRQVSHLENCQNKGLYKNNTSGVKGVSFHKATNKWRVSMRYKNKQHEGGLFDCKEHAEEFADLMYQMLRS